MFFDRVVSTGYSLQAYFKGELVAMRVKGEDGWMVVPLEKRTVKKYMPWKQADLPQPRATHSLKVEPRYEVFEESP